MKAKELIKRLGKIIEEHGDLDVEYAEHSPATGDHGHTDIAFVEAYDANGETSNDPTFIGLI